MLSEWKELARKGQIYLFLTIYNRITRPVMYVNSPLVLRNSNVTKEWLLLWQASERLLDSSF